MQQSNTWEDYGSSAGIEIPYIVLSPKAHYSTVMDPIMSPLNAFHNYIFFIFIYIFNIILRYKSKSLKVVSFWFSARNFCALFSFLRAH
jgi:hypothetical protein